jgi:putative membrane-bound dehydrogenase-like protein
MLRSLILLPLFCLAPTGADAPGSPVAAGYHQIKLNGHTFTLPVGFTIELAAAPPLADRPIVAALDEKGRLYVCDSSGSNEKVTEQMAKKPHRIMRLEDTNGDGKYDKSTVYVANVMLPEGSMWLNGSLYVAAPPHIWKFTDTNDDGKADKEEIWFDGTKVSKTIGGCANDLHGPYLGPDGWIYWTKGGFEKQEYTVNGKRFVTKAAHIFRARPDGTGIEPVMTGGMDNPVDVVFTPSGERIFSCTFLQHPANGKRDGLIHAVYGAVYGKDHAPIYDHPWTSPKLMEPMTHLGPAAPCGLHRYESDQFGRDYENNLLCCQFNLRKVSRHILVPKGSTFVTKDSDFVVSDQHDFHPTDVIEDADGSLLILDTGGWYKLCCPSSQLVKPDVKGAIYRVRKVGAHKVTDPRGEKIEWAKLRADELAKLLDDPRPVVWWKAISALAAKDGAVAKLLRYGIDPDASIRSRLGAVWTLARIDVPSARVANRGFISNGLGDIRQAALHVASLLRDENDIETLGAIVSDQPLALTSAKDRRLAAEALGRIGDTAVLQTICDALSDPKNDPLLDHALSYALLEMSAPKATASLLSHKSPRIRRATVAALDQMANGKLDAKHVLAELNSPDAALRETAWWIAGRHPEWGNELAGHFKDQFKRIEKMTPPEQDELVGRAVPFLKTDAIRKTVGEAVAASPIAPANRAILRGMARSGLKAFPVEWHDGVLLSLNSRDPETVRDAIAVLRAVPPSGIQHEEISGSSRKYRARLNIDTPPELDFALKAAAPAGTPLSAEQAADVIASLHRDKNGPVRAAAADLLNRPGEIHSKSLIALVAALRTMNPSELGRVIPVFAKSKEEAVGLALVAALMETPVRVEVVKPVLEKYPTKVQAEAEKLYAKLAEARKDDIAKLERLVKELPAGDIRRGQAVFNGAKAQCAACHKIGFVGGQIGPDLTKIGGPRSERDLLESIVFPSASFVRSYEPVRVVTTDGRVLNGILKKDAPDEIILTIAVDKEERLARADVESLSPGNVSVMPDGLDKQLTPQELADLVAFLKASK